MVKDAFAQLLERVQQVVQAAGLFAEFETAQQFSLRVENETWMPLVIKSWPTPDALLGEKRRILVAHYGQPGDLPDPELEMTDLGFPIRLRQTVWGVLETLIVWRDPATQQVMVDGQAKREIAELVQTWASNIKAQGFVQAASRIVLSEGRGTGAPRIALVPDRSTLPS